MTRTISSFEREILEFTTHQAQSKTKSERSGLREFSEKMYKGVIHWTKGAEWRVFFFHLKQYTFSAQDIVDNFTVKH